MHYDTVLSYMGEDNKNRRKKYRDFILQELAGKLDNPLKNSKGNAILGSDSFIDWVKAFLKQRILPPSDFSYLREIKKRSPSRR